MTVGVRLALDSGAFSLFKKHIAKRGTRGPGDVSYLKTKQFSKYVDDYCEYVRKYRDKLEFFVSIDVIGDAQASYDVWKELLRHGLVTIPVIHYGEDISWVKKYLNDCDYVGVGGLAFGGDRSQIISWVRKVFSLTRKHKTHGFAVTSLDLMHLFPWTSVDSTSPFVLSRYGKLCVPRLVAHPYTKEYGEVHITDVLAPSRASYLNSRPLWKKRIDAHLASLQMTAWDVANSHVHRDAVNIFFYMKTAQAISERRGYPLHLYLSGSPTLGPRKFVNSFPLIASCGIHDINYMGTFAIPKPIEYFMANGYHNGNRKAPLRSKARPALHSRYRPNSRTPTLLLRK